MGLEGAAGPEQANPAVGYCVIFIWLSAVDQFSSIWKAGLRPQNVSGASVFLKENGRL
jgi:hypothetical protein